MAAAGNGGLEVKPAPFDPNDPHPDSIYPAALAPVSRNVISVASHGPDGKLAQDSNFGADAVDLAAPGVCIPSTTLGPELAPLSGTSQAAAFVSLAAALLHSEGLRFPAHIRERLLASVDFDPALLTKVASGGRLNIAKALTFRLDYIELRDTSARPLVGRIAGVSVAGQPTGLNLAGVPLTRIRKLAYDPSRLSWRLWRRASGGRLRHEETTVDASTELRIVRDGVETVVSISEIADLIPRM